MDYALELEKNMAAMKELTREFNRLRFEWVEKECPFKVGDKIEIPIWPHEGKTGVIRNITVYEKFPGWAWWIRASICKKNGEAGKRATSFAVPMKD